MDVTDKIRVKNTAFVFCAIAMLIVANELPYVVMGEWHNTLDEFANTGWLHTISG